jgi:hypothetical protein
MDCRMFMLAGTCIEVVSILEQPYLGYMWTGRAGLGS